MTEDMIAQYRAKIERLQADNAECRRQMEELREMDGQLRYQLGQARGERDAAQVNFNDADGANRELRLQLAVRETALAEARGHVTELREGFCVYACPDEGHQATCVNAGKWLAGK
jgi:chromosome segregation ATPase